MPKSYSEIKIKVPRFKEENGFYTTPKRSKVMAKIKGKNTKPEVYLRRILWRKGLRYRTNDKTLAGKPDISNKSLKLAVFVDGEFWHGFRWEERKPAIKKNRAFWIPKIERNSQRDQEVNAELKKKGFKVFRFWQHEVKNSPEVCVEAIMSYVAEEKAAQTNTSPFR